MKRRGNWCRFGRNGWRCVRRDSGAKTSRALESDWNDIVNWRAISYDMRVYLCAREAPPVWCPDWTAWSKRNRVKPPIYKSRFVGEYNVCDAKPFIWRAHPDDIMKPSPLGGLESEAAEAARP